MDEAMRALERSANQGDPEAKAQLARVLARMGAHESSATVLGELEALEDAQKAASRAFRLTGKEELEQYLAAMLAREPGLSVVTIRGYTPGFCDGDVCEHTQEVLLGDDDGPGDVPAERAREYTRALGEFEPVLHALHGTDWQLTARWRVGGGLELARSDYQCGY